MQSLASFEKDKSATRLQIQIKNNLLAELRKRGFTDDDQITEQTWFIKAALASHKGQTAGSGMTNDGNGVSPLADVFLQLSRAGQCGILLFTEELSRLLNDNYQMIMTIGEGIDKINMEKTKINQFLDNKLLPKKSDDPIESTLGVKLVKSTFHPQNDEKLSVDACIDKDTVQVICEEMEPQEDQDCSMIQFPFVYDSEYLIIRMRNKKRQVDGAGRLDFKELFESLTMSQLTKAKGFSVSREIKFCKNEKSLNILESEPEQYMAFQMMFQFQLKFSIVTLENIIKDKQQNFQSKKMKLKVQKQKHVDFILQALFGFENIDFDLKNGFIRKDKTIGEPFDFELNDNSKWRGCEQYCLIF